MASRFKRSVIGERGGAYTCPRRAPAPIVATRSSATEMPSRPDMSSTIPVRRGSAREAVPPATGGDAVPSGCRVRHGANDVPD